MIPCLKFSLSQEEIAFVYLNEMAQNLDISIRQDHKKPGLFHFSKVLIDSGEWPEILTSIQICLEENRDLLLLLKVANREPSIDIGYFPKDTIGALWYELSFTPELLMQIGELGVMLTVSIYISEDDIDFSRFDD